MRQIFISVSNEDLVHARALRDVLQRHNFDVFLYTTESVAGDWRRRIEESIAASDVFIAFESVSYHTSPLSQMELTQALIRHNDGELAILPIFLDDIKPSGFLGTQAGFTWLPYDVDSCADWVISNVLANKPDPEAVNRRQRGEIALSFTPYTLPYKEIGFIGEGAFADVYSGVNPATNRTEAIKVLRNSFRRDSVSPKRFLRGCVTQQALRHPNIVEVHEVNSRDLWFSMEYMERGDLWSRATSEHLTLDAIGTIFEDVCNGVDFAHGAGVVHRDLKPANVLLTKDYHAKISDFDLAHHEDVAFASRTGTVLGSFPFLAPEVLADPKHTSRQSDIYSLGVILLFLLTRDQARWALDPDQVRKALRQVGRDRFSPILTLATASHPSERYDTVDHFRRDVHNILSGRLVSLSSVASRSYSATAPSPISDSDVDILRNIALWDDAPEPSQDRVIDHIAALLKPRYVCVSVNQWTCQELRHRIATFELRENGILFHLIPGGAFVIGTADRDAEFEFCKTGYPDWERRYNDREQPCRLMHIAPFMVSRFPLLQRQWDRVKEELGLRDKRSFVNPEFPITNVSWEDVEPFLASTGTRLLSESEWEYSCRAGSQDRYYWGAVFDPSYCWYKENAQERPQMCQLHLGRANAFGLVDMLGNVWEWCADAFEATYDSTPTDGTPLVASDNRYRVQRGGGWNNSSATCRSAMRSYWALEDRINNTGFRLAYNLAL